jgi:hypothetical protein
VEDNKNHRRKKTASEVERNLAGQARRILQIEMKRQNYSYKDLSKLLAHYDLGEENHVQLKTKINRGKFSFVFVMRVMRALSSSDVTVTEPPPRDESLGPPARRATSRRAKPNGPKVGAGAGTLPSAETPGENGPGETPRPKSSPAK